MAQLKNSLLTSRSNGCPQYVDALNPRLAKKVTEVFCQKIIEPGKTVFMTTHNPLVLDGLDLSHDDIRLFTTERSENGQVELRRVQVSEELL